MYGRYGVMKAPEPRCDRQIATTGHTPGQHEKNYAHSHDLPYQPGQGRYQSLRAWRIALPSSDGVHGALLQCVFSTPTRQLGDWYPHRESCRKPIHTPSAQPIATKPRPSAVSDCNREQRSREPKRQSNILKGTEHVTLPV